MAKPLPLRALFRFAAAPVAVLAVACSIAADATAAEAATTWTVFATGTPRNPSDRDAVPIELGLRFSSTQDGTAVGVRFYKSAGNTGTHIGNLWSATGERLASATFTGESATGWQSVRFARPVPVEAGVPYVVSYHTTTGHYAADEHAFGAPVSNGPLRATGSVYRYGASGFPTSTHGATNYWVDVSVAVGGSDPAPAPDPEREPTDEPEPEPEPEPDAPEVTTLTPTASAGAWPDDATTGVPPGTTLTERGSFTVSTPGTVIDALDVTGTITVAAPNVTIKRTRFAGTGQRTGVEVRGGSVRVEDCEFRGTYTNAAVGYENFTLLRSEITGVSSDGVKIGDNTTVQDNWFHDFATRDNTHADGAQVEHGLANAVIRRNRFDLSTGQNAALFISPSLGPDGEGPLLVENNLFGGGNYSLYVLDGDYGNYVIKDITVRGNRFLRTARYGPSLTRTNLTDTGNVWDDTGTVIAL